MNNRERNRLQNKLRQDTERFLNRAVKVDGSAEERSGAELHQAIDKFLQDVSRIGQLRGGKARKNHRQTA